MNDGFFGYRTSLMLDTVITALVLVVPVLATSLYLVKVKRAYHWHKFIQLGLSIALLVTVLAFEVDLRFVQGGWQNVVKKGPPVTSEQMHVIHNVLRVHLIFAGSTPILWAVTIFLALRRMPNPPRPCPHSSLHKVLGWASTIDLVLTSVTGLIFYYVAFIQRG